MDDRIPERVPNSVQYNGAIGGQATCKTEMSVFSLPSGVGVRQFVAEDSSPYLYVDRVAARSVSLEAESWFLLC